MPGYLKELFQKIREPDLKPLRNRIPAYIIALPIAFFIMRAKDFSILISAVVALCFAVFLTLSVFFELKSIQKGEKLKEDVESGDYYSSDVWNEKYLNYLNKHGFDKIKGSSMKADLAGRFRRPSVFIMTAFSFCLLGLCFVPGLQAESIVFLIIGAAIFFGWGMYNLTSTPVRKFLNNCSSEVNEIENSYMNGKLLTFKRNGSDKYLFNGINIGRAYTIIYDKTKITAIKNSDIELVHRYLKRTRYYGNSVYNGSKNTFHLDITLKAPFKKTLTVELNEFQTQMALEEYRSLHIPTTYEGNVVNNEIYDVG